MMAIKALLLGISDDQVSKLYDTTRRNVSRWIHRFNTSGIDGLTQRPRPGRPRKITPGGRTSVRNLLYMAALVASRHNKIIKEFYSRLRNSGKKAKVAIVARIRKLVVILNAMLKKKQHFFAFNN